MEDIAAELRANTDDVMRRWEARADAIPWINLPDAARRDALPRVIRGLADAALTQPPERELVREAVRCAVDHGRDRRRQGLAVEDILTEYYALRTAIWSHLREQPFHIGEVADAMLRIDAAITTATGASLVGYHDTRCRAARSLPTSSGSSPNRC